MHNGVDIDEYILIILYPSIVFFVIGFITKKINTRKSVTYVLQSAICFIFSITYYILIPHGGAQGLALVLGIFGILLLILARKEKINPTIDEDEVNNNSQNPKL